jgi:hypothetical protein
LPNILNHGLLSTNEMSKLKIGYQNIAYDHIQDRRSKMNVSCTPYGVVHDYIPLYFCKKSPMIYAVIKQKMKAERLIYLEYPISILEGNNSVFTSFSANCKERPTFYNDPKYLRSLDWNAIDGDGWGLCYDPSGNKRKYKQAEALIYKYLPLIELKQIVVSNRYVKSEVENQLILSEMEHLSVTINRNYFY